MTFCVYPNLLFLREGILFIPPVAAPSKQNESDAACSKMLCHTAQSDDGKEYRHSAPIRDNTPHIAAVTHPHAIAASPHFFAEINPPRKFDGKRARSDRGGIRESGSELQYAIRQTALTSMTPDRALTKRPISEDISIFLKRGVSSCAFLLAESPTLLWGIGKPPAPP